MQDVLIKVKYSLEAERCFLATIFLNPQNIAIATDLISIEMFYLAKNQRIFSAMIRSYKIYQDINLVSVSEVLGKKIEDIGGDNYLLEILNEDPVPSSIKTFAKVIFEKHQLRQIDRWHLKTGEFLGQSHDSVSAIKEIERSVVDLSAIKKELKKPDVRSIQVDILTEWEQIEKGDIRLIPTDPALFTRQPDREKLIEFMPYHWPDMLVAIGGWTSNGKSTLLAELSKGIGRAGGSQLVFSTEDSRKGKLMQLIANMTGIHKMTFKKLRTNHPTIFKRFLEASEEINSWPIKIYDDVRTIDDIRLKIIQEKMKRDVDVVFLDYVQNLRGKGSLYEKMSYAALTMQEIVIDLNVCVVFFSQLDNQSKRDGGAVMNLKGAGELSAVVDTKIILAKENQNKPGCENHLLATFEKNRDGPCRALEWQFTKSWTGIESRSLLECKE